MKSSAAIAIAVGMFVSALIDALGFTLSDDKLLQFFALPGHLAVISIFGSHARDDVPIWMFMIVGTCANIIAYGLITYGILKWTRRSDDSGGPTER